MKYQRSARFKKDYKELSAELQAAVKKAFLLFQQDPRHASLRVKKMEGFKDLWEGHITLGYVFTFHWETDQKTKEQIAVFRRVGKHDEVYDNP